MNDGEAIAIPFSFLIAPMRSLSRTLPLQIGSFICFSGFAGSRDEDWPRFRCARSSLPQIFL